ncbi:hypothetical protein B0H65DRAFT_339953 [Neurospora tetraspora]|uniref:Uncharacterized protein n=1 Tax=Neurospora tetraspora TaxID=94610 RepID=A0AAE0ML19_9PEZI|nr:hypothetical protein B0H65DRAFT_339953 [Neurospora tetraspora]
MHPIVCTINWYSHYLRDNRCKVQLHWLPRCSTLSAAIADYAAGLWRRQTTIYSQEDLLPAKTDGIMNKLHQEVRNAVHRSLSEPPDAPKDKRPAQRRETVEPRISETRPSPPVFGPHLPVIEEDGSPAPSPTTEKQSRGKRKINRTRSVRRLIVLFKFASINSYLSTNSKINLRIPCGRNLIRRSIAPISGFISSSTI